MKTLTELSLLTPTEEILGALNLWAPNLGEALTRLSYLGSSSETSWYTKFQLPAELGRILHADGQETAAEMWCRVLRDYIVLPPPGLLLILEHMRRHPVGMMGTLNLMGLGFSKTLANVAYRSADALYEDAKYSFARHEIDVGIARLRVALSEFRFCIESQLLSDKTKRIATGKYATAVAMIGRWANLAPEMTARALLYSKESMILGNDKPETLTYRLELLALQFDQTGDLQLLQEAVDFLEEKGNAERASELAEVEVRCRLALLPQQSAEESRRQLNIAAEKLKSSQLVKGSVEEARGSVLYILVIEAKKGRLKLSSRSLAVPKGLLSVMATSPSAELWRTIRRVVNKLETVRVEQKSVPAAALSARLLRQMVDGPEELLEPNDLSRYVDVTDWLSEKASYNRHVKWEAGAAALLAAKRTSKETLARRSKEIFENLTVEYPSWPLPRIGIARVQDYLFGVKSESSFAHSASWRDAALLALNSPMYARSNLGGRNQVFAVADARGFLSETFVFKPTTKSKAEHEASMLSALRSEIGKQANASLFEVPRSLAIVEIQTGEERRWIHVTQRASGRLVSSLSADQASSLLEPIVDLLAVFHRVGGMPPAGKSAWQSLKDYLKMWSKTLFEPEQAERFVASLREHFPAHLPLVRKRDGHASNWLVDPVGRIVAIDFESTDFVPVGYEVAQLIEDDALIQTTQDGWRRRLEIMARYLNSMGCSLSVAEISSAYGWFAITRALRLGTERGAGKKLRRHARELCSLLTEIGDDSVKNLSTELLNALSRIELGDSSKSAPSHDHRRLSKAMAHMLRHHGPKHGVAISNDGFASRHDLAKALKVDSSELLAVAEHPGEPRFEVRGGEIRALYGHSLDVVIKAGIKVGTPACLFHGSSWSVLDLIVRDGLIPMQRRRVHLTNIADEAIAVGERKGPPVVISINQNNEEVPIAEGIWVAPTVSPDRISIVNPFKDELGIAL